MKIEMHMSGLETKNFVAAPEDIREITQAALEATQATQETRGTYLKALVATTQNELGIAVSRRRGVPAPMDAAETARQLEAMERVHERFYKEVMAVVMGYPIKEEERGMKREVLYANRATFARTSKATLRAWLLSENSIRSLTASKVTKYGLLAEVTKKRSPVQARAPSERFLTGIANKLLDRVKAAKSTEQSVRLLEVVINQLVNGMLEMGVGTTTKLEEALNEHKLLQTQTGIVWAARAEQRPMQQAA